MNYIIAMMVIKERFGTNSRRLEFAKLESGLEILVFKSLVKNRI